MPGILTITLNPALDVSTSVDALEPQRKMRCERPRYDPGGGGINVSRAIKELGGESRAFVVLGGATGQHLKSLLDEDGIECDVWQGHGETRSSLQVTERRSGQQYRFILPGPEFRADDETRLSDELGRQIQAHGLDFVVASGSLPPGLSPDFYARLARQARAAGAKFILDTSGPAFHEALSARPYLIRPDRLEAQELLDGSRLDAASARRLARVLLERNAAEVVIVALGDSGSLVATADMQLFIRAPRVTVVSAVGAGDSFVAALTLGLAQGWTLQDATGYGVAAAASAVTTEATQLCERVSTERYFEEIARNAASSSG